MNFFEFYNLTPSYFVDESELKKRYYDKMRALHPDMHMSASMEEKNNILQLSSFNNEAFKVLKDFHLRMEYLVKMYGDSSLTKALPPTFLMEMMDTNEEIMELQMEENSSKAQELHTSLKERQSIAENNLKSELQSLSQDTMFTNKVLNKVQEYLLERNYIKRLIVNVDKLIIE